MTFSARIRGIYATALTRFFLDRKAVIVSPSRTTLERFGNTGQIRARGEPDLEINDLENGQGIMLEGLPEAVGWAAGKMKEAFFDAIFRPVTDSGNNGMIDVEFPYTTKIILDELRNRVVPTVEWHHRLRLVVPEYLDLIEEKSTGISISKRREAGRNLVDRFIWDKYEKGKTIEIEHVKLGGKVIRLLPGQVETADNGNRRLVLKRTGFMGRSRYDGLEIEKAHGDYAISEFIEGEWYYTHTYFRSNGDLIGNYYNISTPVEFYPEKIRYVDLEIDVVGWPDGEMGIMDIEGLESYFREGYMREDLKALAMEVAQALVEYS